MKKIFTLYFILVISITGRAQTIFWSEGFGTGCNQGQFANGVVTSNGRWDTTSTGENDAQANVWYISGKCDGGAAGSCADKSCTHSNQSLHISSDDGQVANDASCNYDAGGLCSFFSVCVVTNTRAESPVINCTGRTGITLSFNYLENGDGGVTDYGTLWYYNGSIWAQLAMLPSTNCCGGGCTGNNQGLWTNYSISLPASANNNSNVKIGFNWTNNDDGVGNDPSIAIDSINLSVASGALPPVAKIAATDTAGCAVLCPTFTDVSTNNPTSWQWTFTGSSIPMTTVQNPQGVCYSSAGTYSVKLVVANAAGKDSITLTNYVQVYASPATPSITQSGDTLFCSYDTSYTSYQWYDSTHLVSGATQPFLIITHTGNYNVSVANKNGCAVAVGIYVNYVGIPAYAIEFPASIFPNPATNELKVTGNWQPSIGILSVFDMLGKKIREESVMMGKEIIVNVKNMPDGIYFLQISGDRGRWTAKFVKKT